MSIRILLKCRKQHIYFFCIIKLNQFDLDVGLYIVAIGTIDGIIK